MIATGIMVFLVYELFSRNANKSYYGHTKLPTVGERLVSHVGHRTAYYERGEGLFCSSFDIISAGAYDIRLLETVDTQDSEVARMREQYHLDMNRDRAVNKRNAYRSPEDKKEQMRESVRRYRKKNPEKVKEQNRLYYQKNPEKKKDYQRMYRTKYSDEIRERVRLSNAVRINCEVCDTHIAKGDKARHERSTKHLDNAKDWEDLGVNVANLKPAI